MTTAQLDAAIAGTAQNPSAVGPFAGSFSNPPTQAELENFAAWVESLRAALVRGAAVQAIARRKTLRGCEI